MEKQLMRTIPYQGDIFNVRHDTVEINNAVETRDVIDHSGTIAVLALFEEKIILVENYRYSLGELTYEIPSIQKQNNSIDSVLESNTNYHCQNYIPLLTSCSTPTYSNELVYFYFANNCVKTINKSKSVVHLVTLKEAIDMINNQLIIDAKTIIAIQHYYINKNKG